MDAVEFLEEQYRMCEALNSHCEECGLSYTNNKTDRVCGDFIKRLPEEAVAIVEKWAKEHPRKTRQSEFLKQHPNASIERGVLELCPALVDQTIPCKPTELSCWECRKINWLAPIEEATNKEIN